MARIRSIHPGLFTDEAFVSLSTDAQVLLFGLYTEADDQGVFEWKPLTLRMRLRPTKDGAIDPMLSEMEAANIIIKYEINGRHYGAIRNFRKYQRPKKPNAIHPINDEIRTYVALTAPSSELEDVEDEVIPQKGEIAPQMEDVGDKMKEVGDLPSLRSGTSPPEVEIQSAIEAYNALAEELGWAVAQKITPKRRAALKRRLADSGGPHGWLAAMAKARASPFLRGETGRTSGHEDWKPDLDFFLQETTFTKLMEGKYDGSGRTKTHRNSAHENFAAGARSLIAEFSGDRNEDFGGGDHPDETGVPLLAP